MKFFFDIDPSVMLGITLAAIIIGFVVLIYLAFRHNRSLSIEADVDLQDRKAKVKLDATELQAPIKEGGGNVHQG